MRRTSPGLKKLALSQFGLFVGVIIVLNWTLSSNTTLEDPSDPFAAWEPGGSRARPPNPATALLATSSTSSSSSSSLDHRLPSHVATFTGPAIEASVAEKEEVYRRQQHKAALANLTPNEGTRNVWDLFEAVWPCRTIERLGRVGDGGKWVCDSPSIARSQGVDRHLRSSASSSSSSSSSSSNEKPCVVYSFGSAGEPSFEVDAHQVLGCAVHSFDPSLDRRTQARLRAMAGVMRFHSVGLGMSPEARRSFRPSSSRSSSRSSTGGGIGFSGRSFSPVDQQAVGFKSLREIMASLGHAHLDVLKVDIEGGEWDVFNEDILCLGASPHRDAAAAAAAPTQPSLPFDQLLVELHYRDEGSLFHFMRGMHAHGFRAFRREANVLDVQRCWEYAFVRVPGLIGAGEAAAREGEWGGGEISDGPTEATRRAAGATSDLRSYLADCQLPEDSKYRKAAEWFAFL